MEKNRLEHLLEEAAPQEVTGVQIDGARAGMSELKNTIFDKILLVGGTILFIVMLITVVGQVFIRISVEYTGFSLAWTEEIARYMMVVSTFLGSAIAMRKNEHIIISIFVERAKPKLQLTLQIIGLLLILLFVYLTIDGTNRMAIQMATAPTASVRWIKVGHLYRMMQFGIILIGIYTLRWLQIRIYELVRVFKCGENTAQGTQVDKVK